MKVGKFFSAVFVLLFLITLNCKKEQEKPVEAKVLLPWENPGNARETVKDVPATQVMGYFLVLADEPKFYDEPGGKLITKGNIKKILDECLNYDDLPRKNETDFTQQSLVKEYIKYYQLTISLNEACSSYVWVSAGEGAFLTPSQVSEYTKTKSSLEPALTEAIASSKEEPLNYASGRKILMMKKPSGPSFYLVNIMNSILPERLKKRIDYYGNLQFVVMEKDGAYTLISPNLKVGDWNPDKKVADNNTEGDPIVASIKYADVDGDGIPEIVTLRPTVGASAGSELYGFVDGTYRIIGQCNEGENCYYTLEGKDIIRHYQGEGDEKDAYGSPEIVKKTERYNYKAGVLTLVPEVK